MQIFVGILGLIGGVLYTIYSDKIADAIGTVDWAERIFGGGGTYKLHKYVGVLIIIISILWTTGTFQWLLAVSLGRLFGSVPIQ